MSTAIITGASRGLGQALARGLAAIGWSLVLDARGDEALQLAVKDIAAAALPDAVVRAIAGDVTDAAHLDDLVEAAGDTGGLELVINNASALGPSPLPALTDYPREELKAVLETNVIAPLALIQAARPLLWRARRPRVINITSDASIEPYEGWGGYGSSKAALDHLGAILAVETPGWRVWTVDPGDLRTQMHQDAFPGEDISDRPEPESVVPAFLALIESDRPSGRVRISEIDVHEGLSVRGSVS